MKTMKKLLSVAMIVVMLFSMSTIAFAQESFSMTIYNAKDTHTYEAYQVFAGTVSDGKLVNIEWGEGVDGAGLLADLGGIAAYKDCESAADVAKVLEGFANDSEELDAFAIIVGKHLTTVKEAAATGVKTKVGDADVYKYEFSGLEGGYYLVKDMEGSQTGHDAYTKYILSVVKVTENLEIFAKSDFPSINKFIEITRAGSDEKELVKFEDVSIGDTVSYLVTSNVPDMDGYEKYRFIVTDVMSKGLTFNGSVEIKIGDETLAAGDYTLLQSGGNGADTTVVIKVDDLTQYEEGDAIEIRYSATVNQHAVVGTAGNLNTVKLEYSNNPNYDFVGTEAGPLGVTPESTTRVYTTAIDITKRDGNNNGVLTGAEFEIKGDSVKKVVVTEGFFEEDENGEYWKLSDGTYTTEDQGEDATKYKLSTKVSIRDIAPTNVQCRAYVNKDGVLKIEGLGAGTYTITEVKAPAGYNLLNKSIEVEVGFVGPEGTATECQWTYKVDGKVVNDGNTDGILKFDVKNYAGTVLPSTGGIGTTLFYTVGSILLIAAVVLIISKKRMEKK